jgi:hypothetical protein
MTTRVVAAILALAIAASRASAEPDDAAPVTGGATIASAPATGLDPDVAARLAAAEDLAARAKTAGDLERALDGALVLYDSPDRFSVGQRARASDRTLAVLDAVADRARQWGDLTLEARARDARWSVAHRPRDPQLAAVLVRWAEREPRPQALYLARRALAADPSNPRAAELDARLSRNRLALPGRAAVILGIVATGLGLYAHHHVTAIEDDLANRARPRGEVDRALHTRDLYDQVGTGLMIGGPLLGLSGGLMVWLGNPPARPRSPAALPVVEQL